MVEQSFKDLGAVFEAEGKAVNRDKNEGREGRQRRRVGVRVGVGAGVRVCRVL